VVSNQEISDLDIAGNTSASVMAKTLFTAKAFGRMARKIYGIMKFGAWNTRWGIRKGVVEAPQ
jgi:hypothetical protein